jgi:hypothetical protein
MRCLPALALLAGCSFTHGESVGRGPLDASTSDASACSFSSQFDTCSLTATGDLTLSGSDTYDASTGMLTENGVTTVLTHVVVAAQEGNVDAIVVHDFHMTSGAQLRVTGMLPLAIVATGSATLDGAALIDLTAGGAGTRASCPGGAVAGEDNGVGAAGGGGGGFGAAGGTGGDGNSDGTPSTGGTGGMAAMTTPTGPLGGCPGARGGTGSDPGGDGGFGGGAIYIVAQVQITLAPGAGINAGGGGGRGGRQSFGNYGDAGGGGGGSGGMIFLESAHIDNGGFLAANGGSGGEASGNAASGNAGNPGQLSTMPAMGGGDNSPTGSNGGNGGAKASPTGDPGPPPEPGGGGGGGGGVGYILLRSPMLNTGATSPATS